MISGSGGTRWGAAQRLNVQPMRPEWLPRTTSGRMLADYLSVSFVGREPVSVYALASPRVGGRFRQAIFATPPLR